MPAPIFTPNRRAMIALLAAAPVLAACKPTKEGPEEVRWGREVCEICGMIISDPRFGAEVRGGPEKKLVKFDDIGDALHWWRIQPWSDDPDVEIWVRDYETGTRWLDARQVRYVTEVVSPMDYGFGAVQSSGPDTVSFDEMYAEVVKIGLTSRCLHTDGQEY
jgi:nitrous oxide reductase accessory protein NosL